jgi:DNA repair exonuclease SbcCD nuclease subunit
LFDEIIDVCVRENINHIIHLGDWYDDRKSLSIPVINKSMEICEKISKNNIILYLVKGNHDQYYVNEPEPTSLSHLKKFENIILVDKEPYYLDNEHILVPWGFDITKLPPNSVLFGHFEINGFVTNYSGHTQEKSKLNISDFSKFTGVFSGHFHKSSKNNNIHYIGSPYPMNFNDIGDKRGYYIFSNKEYTLKEFTSAPKFVRIFDTEDLTEENITGNFVQFVFTEDYGSVKNDKIIQDILLLNPHKLYTDYKIDNVTVDETLNETEEMGNIGNPNIFREYIGKKTLPTHLKKDILLKFLDKIEGEIQYENC